MNTTDVVSLPVDPPFVATTTGRYTARRPAVGDVLVVVEPADSLDTAALPLRRGDIVTDAGFSGPEPIALNAFPSVMSVPYGGRLGAIRAKYAATGFEADATDDIERSQVIGFLLDQIGAAGERLDRRMRDLRDELDELLGDTRDTAVDGPRPVSTRCRCSVLPEPDPESAAAREGAPTSGRIAVQVQWFDEKGCLTGADRCTARRGPDLHVVVGAWAQQAHAATIIIRPAGPEEEIARGWTG